MSTPLPPVIPGAVPQHSSRAVVSVVVGVLGIICCGLLAPIAWYLGNEELRNIDAGRLPESNRGLAQIGKILGIIGTILLVLALLWVVFFGGMAMLSTIAGAGSY